LTYCDCPGSNPMHYGGYCQFGGTDYTVSPPTRGQYVSSPLWIPQTVYTSILLTICYMWQAEYHQRKSKHYLHNTPLVAATGPPDPRSLAKEGRCLYPRRQLLHLNILHPHQQTSSQRESHWVPRMLESTCCHLPSKMNTQLALYSAPVAQCKCRHSNRVWRQRQARKECILSNRNGAEFSTSQQHSQHSITLCWSEVSKQLCPLEANIKWEGAVVWNTAAHKS
jgi:hypothetical protein